MSDSFLRLADVQRRVPFSRSTIYLMISRGGIPEADQSRSKGRRLAQEQNRPVD